MTCERNAASSLSRTQMSRRLLKWGVSEIVNGQLWPVALALTLIIASVFALTALAGRMEQIIVQQSGEALTADLVFESANPLPASLKRITQEDGYQFSDLTQFQTMAFNAKDQMQLVTVKAIDSAYPLKGTMTLQAGDKIRHHVKPNELWLDKRLFALLNVKRGDTLSIGDADFIISGTVQSEPGLRFNPFQQMPAVYIHQQDVKKTGALQLGSRVEFERYINASSQALTRLKQAVTLSPSDEWKDRDGGNRTIRVFERTEQYLSLTVAIVILMAATTLVLTCQHYVSSRQRTIAMLKSLGATKRWILQWLVLQSSVLFVVAAFAGTAIGVVLEFLLRVPLEGMLPTPLPGYGWTPAISAIITCLVIAIPALGVPFSYLLSVSPASAMNATQTHTVGKHRAWWLLILPVGALIAVYYNNALVWMILAGIVGLFALLAVVSLLLTRVIKQFALGPAMTLAVSRIERSKWSSGIQFGALGLSLMLLAVIWLIRTDLLGDWQRLVPQGAANAFALNIAPY
ncbi:MAG: ABC transporter permease, partial [Vibrio sp.]